MELLVRGMRTRKEGSTIQQDSWIGPPKAGPQGEGHGRPEQSLSLRHIQMTGWKRAYLTWLSGSNPSLFASFMPVMALVAVAVSFSACEQQGPEEISWQLPLSAPEDPHRSDVLQVMPDWAASAVGSVDIALLEKNTARLYKANLAVKGETKLLNTEIKVLGAAAGLRLKSGSYINDEKVDNPAVFVEVSEQGKMVYQGWLYKNFPELFGPDSAEWKLWLEDLHLETILPELNEEKPADDGMMSHPG